MGVVVRPIPHRSFDGEILLEQVSEQVAMSRLGSHTNSTDDAITNSMIHNRGWRILVSGIKIMLGCDLVSFIYEHYALDERIGRRIELYATSFIGAYGHMKDIIIKLDENVPRLRWNPLNTTLC